MTLDLKRSVVAAGIALLCTVGLGTAQAANLLATEDGDTPVLTPDANWDVAPFTTTGTSTSPELATGMGQYFALSPANGSALVVLTEGAGGANSDWLLVQYSGLPGTPGTEMVNVSWNSDDDLGRLAPLPENATPEFLAETGGSQDVTALLIASATADGVAFPSNLTVQVQSELDPVPAPLIGFGLPVYLTIGGLLFGAKLLQRSRIYMNRTIVA